MKAPLFLLLLLPLPILAQPAEYSSRGTKSYLVNYGAINGDPFLARFAAKRFVLLDEGGARDNRLVHAVRPGMPILHYKDIVALGATYPEFPGLDRDEYAFLHSADPATLQIVARGDTTYLYWMADRRSLNIAGYKIQGSADSTGAWYPLHDTLVTGTSLSIRIPQSIKWLRVISLLGDAQALNYGHPAIIPPSPSNEPSIAIRTIGVTRDSTFARLHVEAENVGDVAPDSVVLVMDLNRDNILDTLRERKKMTFGAGGWSADLTSSIAGVTTFGGYEFQLLAYKNRMRWKYPAQGTPSSNVNNRIKNDYYDFYVMDVGSFAWRKAYITEVLNSIAKEDYNGLFEDDCWYKLETWQGDAARAVAYNDRSWKNNLYQFLDSIKVCIAPHPAFFNGLYVAESESLLVHTDGGMTEGFQYTHWSGYVAGDSWKRNCNLGLHAQHLFRKSFMALGGAPYNDFQARMYVLGSYLLVQDSLGLFANASEYQEFSHFPEFDIPLGAPLTGAASDIDELKRTSVPNGAAYYVRRFAGADVVVNPNPLLPILYPNPPGTREAVISGDSLTGWSTPYGGRIGSAIANDTVHAKEAKIFFPPAPKGNIVASPLFLSAACRAASVNPDSSVTLVAEADLKEYSDPAFRADTTKPLYVLCDLGALGGPKEFRLLNDGTIRAGVPSRYSGSFTLPVGAPAAKARVPFLAFSTTGLLTGAAADVTVPSGDSANLVLNYSYEIDNDEDGVPDYWRPYVKGFDYDTLGLNARTGRRSVHVRNDSLTEYRGINLSLALNQSAPKDLLVSGWSKALGVSGSKDNDYAIYVDCWYQDGTPLYGQCATFSTGTHDWEYSSRIIHPAKPIKNLAVYVLFRRHTGQAWFDQIGLREYVPPNGVSHEMTSRMFTLEQNFPNPFRDATTVSFRLPERTFVSLQIRDLLGRTVKTLLEGEMERGERSVRIDGSGMRPGLYFYSLVTAGGLTTKLLVKQ